MTQSSKIAILLFFVLLTYCCKAQDYIVNVQQFGLEEGLTTRSVNNAIKDKDGFLWLASPNGLQRYDGYEIKSIPLPKYIGGITELEQLEDGDLYLVNTISGNFLFLNPLTGETVSKEERWGQQKAAAYETLLANRLNGSFSIKKYKEFYFIDVQGLTSVNVSSGKQKLEVPAALWKGEKNVAFQMVDHLHNFWVTTKYEILVISPEGRLINRIKQLPYTAEFGLVLLYEWESQIYSLNRIGSRGKGQDRFYQLNDGERKFIFEAPIGYYIHQFLDGQLWCIGQDGWKIFDLSGKLLFELNRTDYDKKLFDGSVFTVIKKDKTGKFFLPTEFGFNIVEVQKNPFTQYFSNSKENPLPINNSARGIYSWGDSILVNFEFGGLVLFQKGQSINYDIVSNYSARPIIRSATSHFLTGSGRSLEKWSLDLLKKERLDFPEDLDHWANTTWSLFEDKEGCIWSGNSKALGRICNNENTHQGIAYLDSGFGFKEIDVYQIQASHQEKENHLLWLSTNKGVFVFDKNKSQAVAHYHENGEGEYRLPASDILFLHIDTNKNKWLGTRSGLVFWNTKTNEKRLFTRNDGLSNNVIYAVFEDDFGRLWMSSDYGIMSFHKTSFDVQTYLPKHGVTQEEFNRISQFQAADGTIYFGGLNGVTAFHPKDFVKEEKNYAPVVLSDFEIFDGEAGKLINKLKEVTETKSITFHPNDRFFKLKFVLTTLEETSKIRYAWMIEGQDLDWNYQKENSLQIGLLPYGKHILRIKGQSGGGNWSPHELAIEINVIKPFYLQIWFLISAGILLLMGIWGYNANRLRKLQRDKENLEKEVAQATSQIQKDKAFIEEQAEELKKLDKLKSRFFANVSHELRTPLALMIGPIKNLLKSNGHNEKDKKLLEFIERNSLHLKNLVNEILDLSKLENNKMEVKEETVDFYPFLKNHMGQFYSIGNSDSVEVSMYVPRREGLAILLDKNKFEKVINNFLSNAIKFTPVSGQVHLSIIEGEEDLHLTVKDTGRGIHSDDLPFVFDRFYQSKQADAPTEGGTGIGLSLCRELAELMGGKVWAESTFGIGSTFHFQFPKKVDVVSTSLSRLEENDVTPQGAEAASVLQMIEESQSLHKGATILIAEDNADLRAYYEIILSDYKVVLTEHGQAALDYLAKTEQLPNLIISDLMMPVMDGLQLLEKLKSSERWRPIPLIMLTAKTNQKIKIKALRFGIDDYVTKPFDDEELLVRIENLLGNANSRMDFLKEIDNPNEKEGLNEEDKRWLEEFEAFVEKHLDSPLLSISWLSEKFAMSESTLFRHVKKTTGLSPSKYLQEFKLEQARQLLENQVYKTVAQVAYKIGFKDPKHFSRSFKNRFGKAPSEYLVR